VARSKPPRIEPEYTLRIDDLAQDGRGVARHDGKAQFVAGALPGERVLARRVRRHRDYDEAQVVSVEEPSPHRVEPACAHFGTCGGCVLQHYAPAAQVDSKHAALVDALARIGKVAPARELPALTGPSFGYRRRARLSVKRVEKKNKLLVGFRETDGRFVADLARCETLVPEVGHRLEGLAALIDGLDARLAIPQVEVSAGDAAIALTFRHLQALSEGDLERMRAYGAEAGLAIYLQSGGPDSVVALAAPPEGLWYALGALKLQFEPLDFIQVNGQMNVAMVRHALALLDPGPGDRVLDLFCGLGNFTLPIAERAGSVVGVEGDRDLVARARLNAVRNGLERAEFVAADLFADQRQAPWAAAPYDLMLLDPPRAGAREVLEYLPRKGVRRVVYVSCHPASLARDAGTLVREHGYTFKAAGVMDMFPHTAHVESIAMFER